MRTMAVAWIAAGVVTLAWWWIANNACNTGYGTEATSCFSAAIEWN